MAECFSPELQVLVCCARRTMRPDDRDRLRALVGGPLDFDRLLAVAVRHGMLPLLWSHLGAQRSAVPPQAAREIEAAFMRNAGRMLLLTRELLALIDALRAKGVLVVPYKGPALGAQLYGSLALRQGGDLDIVVRPHDVQQARDVLLRRGYRVRHALSPAGREFMTRSRYGEEFDHPDGPSVELHWAFTNGDVALPLRLDDVAGRLESVRVGASEVAAFALADLLVILCVHGAKHRWNRLELIAAVAELMRGAADLNWNAVLRNAARLGVRRMLLLGVVVAHDLLNAPVPERVMRIARADRAVARLAARVPQSLTREATDDGRGGLESNLFQFQLRERGRDRVRFVWYRLTTPSRPESWRAVRLGSIVVPLHGIALPFRVLRKLGPRWARAQNAPRRATES